VTINQAAGQADPAVSAPINFTMVFSAPVNLGNPTYLVISGTAGGTKTATVTGNGTTYNIAVTGMSSNGTVIATLRDGGAFTPAALPSLASTSTDNSVTYNAPGPTVTVEQAADQADPTGTSPVDFTVTFRDPVDGFIAADVVISGSAGGPKNVLVEGGPSTYHVAVSGMTTQGSVIATVPAGVANNPAGDTNLASSSTDNSVYWMPGGPSVTINQAAGQADPTGTSPIQFLVVFSAPVTGFTGADVAIGGTAGGTRTATVTGIGTTYEVAVAGMTTAGTVIATVPDGIAQDAGPRPNLSSTSTDNTVTWAPVSAPTTTTITLTTSAPVPPGAQSPVIRWGQSFTLGVQFGPNGANRSFQLQGTRDEVTWTTITTLTSDANGQASLLYSPVTNLFYRAVFPGTADLGAATSNQVRTVVRQLAVGRPTNNGSTKSIARNTSITFTTTVRPARPELAPATVSFFFYQRVSGVWRLVTTRAVVVVGGLARTTFQFSQPGEWYVRSQAGPTAYNANSEPTPIERYSVR
jgi:hypothetical protein